MSGEARSLAGLESVPQELWPARADPRVGAIVSLAGDALFFGQAGLARIAVPVLAIGGTLNSDSPYLWGTHPTYECASGTAKVRIALTDAEHMIFTGPCEWSSLLLSFFTGEFCSEKHLDRNRAHDLFNHFVTAFLLATPGELAFTVWLLWNGVDVERWQARERESS